MRALPIHCPVQFLPGLTSFQWAAMFIRGCSHCTVHCGQADEEDEKGFSDLHTVGLQSTDGCAMLSREDGAELDLDLS